MPLSEGYPHSELLETPAGLAEHLHDPDVKVLDTRPAEEYIQGHISGAVSLPPRSFKKAGSLETCSPEEFTTAVGALGIRSGDTVICYDASGPSAARAWWAFARFGHRSVRFLHGGIRAWQAAGYPVETDPRSYHPVRYKLGDGHDEIACTLPQAIGALGDADVVFWDTRSREEYTGERGVNNPPDRVGHIPRAVHLEWSELTDPATGLFRPADEMRRVLAAKGITPEKEIVTY